MLTPFEPLASRIGTSQTQLLVAETWGWSDVNVSQYMKIDLESYYYK